MSNQAIIAISAAVFAVALLLILRELRRPAERKEKAPVPGPPPEVARASTDEPDEEEDVTKVGEIPRKPKLAEGELPRLMSHDAEADEPVSESTALTVFETDAEIDEPTGPHDLIVLAAAGQTDTGKKRKRNEDSYLVDEEHSVFVVADGMGGYAGGDVASRIAVETIQSAFESGQFEALDERRPRRGAELVNAIERANNAVYAEAYLKPELHGMGSTIVAARFSEKKQRVFIAHVGDSRCYRLRDGELKLLTTDHTFEAKGVTGPMAAHIRRAVGIKPKLKVDLHVDCPRPRDLYLLCSDGLNKMLGDETTRSLLCEHQDSLTSAVDSLIKAANEAGGKDNTTVILVGVRDVKEKRRGSQTTAQAAAV